MSTLKFEEWYNSDGTRRETILQTVQYVKSDASAYSPGTGWLGTDMIASITPMSVHSRIMIMFTAQMATGYWELQGKFMRKKGVGGTYTDIGTGSRRYQTNANTECGFIHSHYFQSFTNIWYPISYNFIDIPRSTDTLYYQLYVNSYGSNAVYINRTRGDTDAADYNGSPISSITLMEIAA